jgi:sugar/nucleoside kinase (ribokinase family)
MDILGLGCTTIDDLLYVAEYPPADSKQRVQRRERQCGGLTATALVAAARLGASCAYAGTSGLDDLSQFVLDSLEREGVDVSLVKRQAGARPIHAVVIVDAIRQTRTLFYDMEGVLGAQDNWPEAKVIRSARVLFVDHLGIKGMIRAARIARETGVPVVADFESNEMPQFPELLDLVDHLILSRSFAEQLTGQSDPGEATRALWSNRREVVVITCGGQGCWAFTGSSAKGPKHHPAFQVDVVDTTGCGDVFHGAYAAALACGHDMEECINFASAAAALKATRRGGQAGIPSRAAVKIFLESHTK